MCRPGRVSWHNLLFFKSLNISGSQNIKSLIFNLLTLDWCPNLGFMANCMRIEVASPVSGLFVPCHSVSGSRGRRIGWRSRIGWRRRSRLPRNWYVDGFKRTLLFCLQKCFKCTGVNLQWITKWIKSLNRKERTQHRTLNSNTRFLYVKSIDKVWLKMSELGMTLQIIFGNGKLNLCYQN